MNSKYIWVKERVKDCGKHYVCEWMREMLEREKIKEGIDGESEKIDGESKKIEDREDDELRMEMERLLKVVMDNDSNVKKTDSEKLERNLITVYGDIQLSQEERKFLLLGPNFPLMEDLRRKR